ncbi:MAG: GGDEF domain-containing protein [Bacillota bacterium]
MIVTVEKIMKRPVLTAKPEDSVANAANKMELYGIGCLPVLEQEVLVGILTSRDIRRSHPNRLVADAMSKKLYTIKRDSSLWTAFSLLREKQIERLPVLDEEERLIGLVTKSNLMMELGKYTDPLTGLYTSDYIRFIGETLLKEEKEFAILFIDLDGFGEFNKKHGHVVGDKCLQLIAETLGKNVYPETDFLCRYGGDEFVFLTTKTVEEVNKWAVEIQNNIQLALKAVDLSVGATIGIAWKQGQHCCKQNASWAIEELINQASLGSTRAKREKSSVLFVG